MNIYIFIFIHYLLIYSMLFLEFLGSWCCSKKVNEYSHKKSSPVLYLRLEFLAYANQALGIIAWWTRIGFVEASSVLLVRLPPFFEGCIPPLSTPPPSPSPSPPSPLIHDSLQTRIEFPGFLYFNRASWSSITIKNFLFPLDESHALFERGEQFPLFSFTSPLGKHIEE